MQSAMAALAASAHFWLWFWEKFELPPSIIIKVLERNTLLGLLKCVYIDERWYFRVIIVFWHCSMETLNCVIGGQAWKTRNSKLPPFLLPFITLYLQRAKLWLPGKCFSHCTSVKLPKSWEWTQQLTRKNTTIFWLNWRSSTNLKGKYLFVPKIWVSRFKCFRSWPGNIPSNLVELHSVV